ncbi:MAG: hypothetical protein ACJAXW_002977 [Candidatus Azotimanducaceae bacterium]|jgi:hypothetical protein
MIRPVYTIEQVLLHPQHVDVIVELAEDETRCVEDSSTLNSWISSRPRSAFAARSARPMRVPPVNRFSARQSQPNWLPKSRASAEPLTHIAIV